MNILLDKLDNSVANMKVNGYKKADGTHPKYFVNSSLTFYEEGYQFTYKYKHGLGTGRRSLFNSAHNSYSLGLVPRVYHMLRKKYPDANVQLSAHLRATFEREGGNISDGDVDAFFNSLNLPYTPYDYQHRMVKDAINMRRRTFSACTGSGKSLVIYAVSRWMLEKEDTDVLVIVPSMALVEQIYSDFQEYGWNEISHYCSKLHSQIKKPTAEQKREMAKYDLLPDHMLKRVVISTWQSLAPKKPEFFKRFGCVLCDEAHSAQADILSGIIFNCRNASMRVGLSGTVPDMGLSAHIIAGCIGPTSDIVKPPELIKRGILTPTRIVAIKIPYDERSKKIVKKMKYAEEVEATSLCGSTEKLIVELIDKNKITSEQNTVILLKHIELLDRIYYIIKEKYPNLNPIKYHGAVNVNIREKIREEVENSEGNLVICTYGTMKQGVNIKRINNIIFGQGSSSVITVRQSIGRGLRIHPKKPILTIYDLIDDLTSTNNRGSEYLNYAVRHYKERLKYYEDDEYPVIEFNAPFTASFDDIQIK